MNPIPAHRLWPILAESERRGFKPDAKSSTARLIWAIRNERAEISFSVADRLLVELGMQHEWHGELADLYEADIRILGEGGIPSNLSHDQVAAAYKLYCDGMSIVDLARQIWQRCGYKSIDSCRFGLTRAFKMRGYKTRSRAEARQILFRDHRCGACGVAAHERTPGCAPCRHRHARRKEYGRSYVPITACSRCGVDYDERTPGCNSCAMRHWRRKRAGKDYVNLWVCSGCGVHRDERTVGCKTCKTRFASRRDRTAKRAAVEAGKGSRLPAPQRGGTAGGTTLEEVAA